MNVPLIVYCQRPLLFTFRSRGRTAISGFNGVGDFAQPGSRIAAQPSSCIESIRSAQPGVRTRFRPRLGVSESRSNLQSAKARPLRRRCRPQKMTVLASR
jgi:hypothetical protein